MISFRNRRVTLVPSTLTFALLCQAGMVFAQSPDGWPFEEKPLTPSSPAPQAAPQAPKTPVQQKLEELYRRDGRALPDYMRTDAAPDESSQNAQKGAPLPFRPAQQPAPVAMTRPAASGPASEPQGSIRQQLAEYYASQGRIMPGTRSGWNAAEAPRQPVAANGGQAYQPGSAVAPAPQSGVANRLNPFRSFWHKDEATSAPPAAATTNGYATSGAMSSQNGGTYWKQPAPAPVQPKVMYASPSPPPNLLTVDLGASAPINSISQGAMVERNRMIAAPAPAVVGPQPPAASQMSQSRSAAAPAAVAASPTPTASTARTPSGPPQPAAAIASGPAKAGAVARGPANMAAIASGPAKTAATASGPVKVAAAARDDRPPFDPKSESDADTKPVPYTGLTLEEGDDAVTAPDPTKVTTANANEPADHAPASSGTAVDAKQPKNSGTTSAVAAKPASSSQTVALPQPEASRVTQERPLKSAVPESAAPKAFEERQPASELPRASDDTAAKMHKIGERIGQRGLKGFCPVVLREQRELVDALPVYSSRFENKCYYFSSAEAKSHFDQCPQKYAPIAGGVDVVVKSTSDQALDGTLDFAAWYKDRLFLFSSPESFQAFSLNPLAYAGPYLQAH